MSISYDNIVQETTNTTGSGAAISLGGAAGPRSRTFSSRFATGATVGYTVYDGDGVHWITVSGTYSAGTLSRTGPGDVIIDGSSGPGVDIALSGSTPHTVFCDLPAQYAPAMVLLAEWIVSTPANGFTFNNLPQNFRHLQLIQDARITDSGSRQDIAARLNGDAGNNYDRVWGAATAATTSTANVSGGATITTSAFPYAWTAAASAAAGESTVSELWVYNYSGTTFTKKMRSITVNNTTTTPADNMIQMFDGHWRSTAAVTALSVFDTTGGNIVAGSVFSLYGIR